MIVTNPDLRVEIFRLMKIRSRYTNRLKKLADSADVLHSDKNITVGEQRYKSAELMYKSKVEVAICDLLNFYIWSAVYKQFPECEGMDVKINPETLEITKSEKSFRDLLRGMLNDD